MADIITNIKALAPNAVAVATVAAAGGDVNGMLAEVQLKASELVFAVNQVIAALPPGDSNLATLNGTFVSLLTVGQLLFNQPAQSGHIATAVFNFG